MKKLLYRIVLIATLLCGFSRCNYLDVVPDEMATDKDAFADALSALRYVYSCYAYLPQPNAGSSSLDFMTGDEVVTAFEHETFANFAKGNYTSANVANLISYWNTFYTGLRQCYLFLQGVDTVPDLSPALKEDYIAQVKFLIGYYYFLMIRCYGPVLLVEGVADINTPAESYLARTPLDQCVEYCVKMFDEAASVLPPARSTQAEYGLATSVAAKAIKAELLLYVASPLFNGNSEFYSDFTNKDGTQLMPLTYDPAKWETAKTAIKDAIDFAEKNGHALYYNDQAEISLNQYPSDPVERRLRYTIAEAGNSEILFATTYDEGYYGLQNKSAPMSYNGSNTWNGVAPTWNMLNRFYTKNGLPYDEDPEFKNLDKLEVVTVDDAHANQACKGEQTIRFNLDREPRFYSWIAFQGGYYEIGNHTSTGAYSQDPTYSNGRLVCDFVIGGNCSRRNSASGALRTNNYSPTGYLNKKGVLPSFAASTGITHHSEYPWPVVRLATLYLSYAEACVETNDLTNAKIYLNKVRARAGIPDVEESWKGVAELTQAKLREIVRQERQIELYLENQNFWDMRRWKLAGEWFNQLHKGMNISAENIYDFAQLTTVEFERAFVSPRNYLMPVPIADLNTNVNCVNNPGY